MKTLTIEATDATKTARVTRAALLLMPLLLLGAGSTGASAATQGAGEAQVSVQQVRTFLMPKPKRFAKSLATLTLGTPLQVVDSSLLTDGWIKVRTRAGMEGYVHSAAIARSTGRVGAGTDRRGTNTRGETVQLAARGFSEEVEAQSRKQHSELRYDLVDAIESSAPKPGQVAIQAQEGGVLLEGTQ